MENSRRDPITGEWDDPLGDCASDRPADPTGDSEVGARSNPPGTSDDEVADDAIGYRKPPRKHRFPKGRSGNPKGRKKGVKNEATIVNELLEQMIPIRVDGRRRSVTMRKAILMRFRDEALKGDIKSATFILNRQNQHASNEPAEIEMDQDDRAILDAFTKRVKHSEKGPKE